MATIEVPGAAVEYIGQVGQFALGVHGRRLERLCARQARSRRRTRSDEPIDGIAAQGIDGRGRQEPGFGEDQLDLSGLEIGGAQLAQVLAGRDQCPLRVLRRFLRLADGSLALDAVLVAQRQREAVGRFLEPHGYGDAALCGFLFQQAFEGLVPVAQDFRAHPEALRVVRHLVGEQALVSAGAFGHVDAQAGELLAAREVADAVAVGEVLLAVDFEPVGADAGDRAAGRAGEAGRVEGADIGLAAVDEIVGGAAVEGLFRTRCERVAALAGRGARILRRLLEDAVQQLAVMRGGILDVGDILQPAFYLERADAGIGQGTQVGALVIVLHRQQVFVVSDDAALTIFQRVGQAAGLRAFAAVGAAPGVGVADVALAGKRHAERAMDEEFEHGCLGTGAYRVADGQDLRQRQFARQHHLREADIGEEPGLLRCADVGLGRGVQLDRRQVKLQQTHVLHDQGVRPGLVHLPGQAACRLNFVIPENGVEGDEDPGVETVRVGRRPLDVGHGVAGVVARPEGRPADINRVGAMLDRLDGDVGVAGGGEEFEGGCRRDVHGLAGLESAGDGRRRIVDGSPVTRASA